MLGVLGRKKVDRQLSTAAGVAIPNEASLDRLLSLGPACAWPLQEPAGPGMVDVSGNNCHGIHTGMLLGQQPGIEQREPCIFNDGLTGYSNYNYAAAKNTLILASNTWSIWFRMASQSVWTDGASRVMIATYIDGSNTVDLRKSASSNRLSLAANLSGALVIGTTSTAFADTRWHHFVGIVTPSTVAMYVDGLFSTSTGGGVWTDTAANLFLGLVGAFGTPSVCHSGYLQQAAIFNRALSAAEIAYLYGRGAVQ